MKRLQSVAKLKKDNNGFILFIAIVVASIFLSIGVGIANFTYRELILASTSRNSMYGFYAADAGVECALYYDNVLKVPPPRQPSVFEPEPVPDDPPDENAIPRADSIRCANNNIVLTECDSPAETNNFNTNCRNDTSGVTVFGFSLYPDGDVPSRPFVRVVVEKGEEDTVPITYIRARGVNINNPENLRRVERGLRTKYAK